MSKLTPYNDYLMVEIERNPMGLVDGSNIDEEGVMHGKVVAISDKMTFFGFNTFMFDSSLMDKELLDQIYNFYKGLVGKVVHWPRRTESGAIVTTEEAQLVFVKMSAIMAIEETE